MSPDPNATKRFTIDISPSADDRDKVATEIQSFLEQCGFDAEIEESDDGDFVWVTALL